MDTRIQNIQNWGYESMEESSWEQFMLTGRVEDYLKFKKEEEKSSKMEHQEPQRNNGKEREQLRAGFSKGDGHCSCQYTGRGV